jgi:vitamin B12 transporter
MIGFNGIQKLLQAPLLVILCLIAANPTHAQQKQDSTLGTIKITGKHKPSSDTRLNDFSSGQKVHSIDSLTLRRYQQQSIATMLSQQLPVFVKAYSFNGLATLSFRGASAAQSQVLWNGVPIQNAALGIADVSTLPVLFMSKVNVVSGGSAALYGSGNVGGALLLENEKPVFDSGHHNLSVSGGAGSFGQYTGGISGSIANRRWYVSANTFAQSAQNNYAFTTTSGTEQKMPNARLQSGAAMLHAAYKIAENNVAGLSAWYQQYDRQIPPALFEPYSVKHQQDNSLRLVADWQASAEKRILYARASLIRDAIRYSDSAVQLSTSNSVYQYYQEIGRKQQLGAHGKLLLFAPMQISWLPKGNDTQRQNRIALVAAYNARLFNEHLDAAIQARQEFINEKSIFLPGAGASYRIANWLSLRANVQRTYRMPTLNELYYFPGGNPRLKPEQGWNKDAGYTVRLTPGHFSVHHDLSVFDRRILDWILWLGGAVWTPHNIATVHSRGIETENKLTFTTGNWQLHLDLGTSYILATTTESYLPNDGSVGRQIPYTPRYNGRLNIGFAYKKLYFNYNHSYTGYRFITTDESSWLQPYQTGNLQAMYTTTLSQHEVQLNAQYNNIWNEHYSVAGFRPMPGANWLAGFKVHI